MVMASGGIIRVIRFRGGGAGVAERVGGQGGVENQWGGVVVGGL